MITDGERLQFGLQLTSVHSAQDPPDVQVSEHEELVRRAEELGFDFIGVGQHFLTPELRYLQPVPYLTHMGAVAPSLRLATFILLLPLHNPIDVAEQVATMDVISGGRAIMGVGLGYADHEFEAFGVKREDRVARFEESLLVIRALWAGGGGKHDGVHFNVADMQASTLPVQRPGPPIWAAGQTGVAVRRAARTADGWCVPPFLTHDQVIELTTVFKEERERCGLPAAAEFPVRRELVIADSMEKAVLGAAARSESRMGTYVKWGMGKDYTSGDLTGVDSDNLKERFILGTPEDCATQLDDLRQKVGMTHFAIKPQWPGLPHAEAVEQVDRFGSEVVPLLER
jgi:alkanesulfonate monooxygenase SsuD/methylene tetrahydromethanopterin reductase-like flavin-dependent oxidoreductase (luciferase family)